MIKNTQTFNDGIVRIYRVDNTAENGRMPTASLTLKHSLRYRERTVGMQRFFTARQAQVEIKYVLRCPLIRDVSTQDIAIPNDGVRYKIIQIQYPEELTVMDLTLSELEGDYAAQD